MPAHHVAGDRVQIFDHVVLFRTVRHERGRQCIQELGARLLEAGRDVGELTRVLRLGRRRVVQVVQAKVEVDDVPRVPRGGVQPVATGRRVGAFQPLDGVGGLAAVAPAPGAPGADCPARASRGSGW